MTPPAACCKNPELYKAYLPCWPFAAAYCKSCGDVFATFGGILQLFWDAFVYPFSDGYFKVRVTNIRLKR